MISNGAMLSIQDLHVAYGSVLALQGVSIEVREGEIVTLIGANGAGKSTLLRAISGIVPIRSGKIIFDSTDLGSVPAHNIVKIGVAHVPEGRGIFANLTVQENLKLSTWSRKDQKDIRQEYQRIFDLFPRLAERRNQLAGTLSGGEQQMLAVARALMTRGRLMLLDEPSMGLAPVLVREIFQIVCEINANGTTILLVEQNARQALRLAHRGYVLETGLVTVAGTAGELMDDPRVKAAYLGG
ncbi:MAG TPA: ABC transporter ATP-binding protein [Anaerolineales bacterium]|nr:ABC transporter ATP-binding protein [Anaerolineales bacterium]